MVGLLVGLFVVVDIVVVVLGDAWPLSLSLCNTACHHLHHDGTFQTLMVHVPGSANVTI